MNLVIGSNGEAARSRTLPAARGGVSERRVAGPSLAKRISGLLGDVGLLLLVVVMLPTAILVIGTPVALLVRMLVWIYRQLHGV